MRTIHSAALIGLHVSPLSWSATDTKNAAMAATNFLQPVETGLARQKGSPAPPTLQNAFPPYKSATAIEIALTEATSQGGDSIEKIWLEFRLEKRIEIPF